MFFTILAIYCIALLRFQNVAPSAIPWCAEPHQIKFMEHVEQAKQPDDVVQLWEQAIAAKGGRERLEAVHNLVVSSRAEYRTHLSNKNAIRQETLYVLPNKFWAWNDLRPDVFGLQVKMYNYDTNMKYVISDGEPNHQPEPIADNERKDVFLNSLLPQMPENKWLKPVLVKASVGRIGLRPVNIVETTVHGKRVDFALDQETHLPVRVSYYSVVRGKTYITALDLSDYVEISGIKVPQVVKYDGGTVYKQSYQFNVKYNEDIFIKPPSLSAGPEAWKKQSE